MYQAKNDVRDTLAALQLKKDELDKLEKELGSIMEVIEKNQMETLAALEAERDKQVCICSIQLRCDFSRLSIHQALRWSLCQSVWLLKFCFLCLVFCAG